MYDYLSLRNIILGIPITYFSLIAISMFKDYYHVKNKKSTYIKFFNSLIVVASNIDSILLS